MYILRHPEHCPPSLKKSVVALGNFDGVHKGHRHVIETARTIAASTHSPSMVMTFEPHPTEVLRPPLEPMRITPFRSKAALLKALEVDALSVLRFSRQFSLLTAREFVEHILVRSLQARHIVVGEDFNFGYKRTGNKELLETLARDYGFGVTCVKPVTATEMLCSSTAIRQLIREGAIEKAALLLGYHYHICGRVVKGEQRGRLLGFPTANIALSKAQLRPAYGVYAVKLLLDGTWHNAVANIGKRPTFGMEKDSLEVHIFDFNAEVYGKYVMVEFIRYLRPEQKFDGIEALKRQIGKDVEAAKGILG